MHQSAERCRWRCRTHATCTRVQGSVLLARHVGSVLWAERCCAWRPAQHAAPQRPVLPACTVTRLCTRTARCDGDARGVSSPDMVRGRRGVWACRGPSTGVHVEACNTTTPNSAHTRTSDWGQCVSTPWQCMAPLRCARHTNHHRPAVVVCRPHFAVLAQPLKRPNYPKQVARCSPADYLREASQARAATQMDALTNTTGTRQQSTGWQQCLMTSRQSPCLTTSRQLLLPGNKQTTTLARRDTGRMASTACMCTCTMLHPSIKAL